MSNHTRHWRSAALVAAAAVALGCGATPAADGKPNKAATSSAAAAAKSPEADPVKAVLYDKPTAADFKITVKVTSKHCFGSAGCNVDYRIEVGWTKSYDPDVTYEVIYDVKGGDDPQTDMFTVTGDKYSSDSSLHIQTPPSPKLTAKATDVSEQ